MKMKYTSHWLRPALIPAIYLLSSVAAHCFWNSDGRGDAIAVADSPDAKATVQCAHRPSGDVISAAGPMAKGDPLRFSTKYQDHETDLVYYGYRYYNASTGRWLSRDSIEEAGGLNLFAFVENDPANCADPLGEAARPKKPSGPKPPKPPHPPKVPFRLVIESYDTPHVTGDCGGAESTIKFRLDGAKGTTGWLVQHLTLDYPIYNCSGKVISHLIDSYWEAWRVEDGVIYTGDPDKIMMEGGYDTFGIPNQPVGTRGTALRKDGYVGFQEGDATPFPGHIPEAGGLPSTRTAPAGWSDSSKLHHFLSTKYKCCCLPFEKTEISALPWW
jgi:RHS repeat-associated protein